MTLFGPSKLTPVAATAALVMDKSEATVLVDFGSFIMKLPASPPHSTWSILAEAAAFDLEFFLNWNLYLDPLLLCRLRTAPV